MKRTYHITVTVEVDDPRPGDPDNEEHLVYVAYSQALQDLLDNNADWYAEEVTA